MTSVRRGLASLVLLALASAGIITGAPAHAAVPGTAHHAQVRADDGLVARGLVPASDRSVPSATSAVAAQARLERVYVVVVAVTATTHDDDLADQLDGASIQRAVSEVSAYWNAESSGRVSLTVAQIGHDARKATTCDLDSVFDYEEQHAFGKRFADDAWYSTHDHLLILTDEGAACGYDGFGYIGSGNGVIVSANGTDETSGVPVLRHEFGHNLGFGHADSGLCKNGSSFDGPLSSFAYTGAACVVEPYGDLLDIMGYSTDGAAMHLSSIEKIRMGWLAPGTGYATATPSSTPGLRTLAALDAGTGVRAIRFVDPRTGEAYVIEYRTATGGDASSTEFGRHAECEGSVDGSDGEGNPTTISYGGYYRCSGDMSPTTGGVRVLRDIVPDAGNHESVALAVGRAPGHAGSAKYRHDFLVAGERFRTHSGGVTVSVSSTGGPTAGARVSISFASRARTTVSLTTNHRRVTARLRPRATFTARVHAVSGVVPRGTVSFYDGTRRLARVPVSRAGIARYTVPLSARIGKHRISARFTPARPAGFLPASTQRILLTVQR